MGIFGAIRIIVNNIKNIKKANGFKNMSKEQLLALQDDDFYDAIECVCEATIYDINESKFTDQQKFAYSLIKFETEVNNGGLCQFFVNSSGECAPYLCKAFDAIRANDIKDLFEDIIAKSNINLSDLSSFKITNVDQFYDLAEKYDFESFDDKFYENYNFHQQIIDYARKNVEKIVMQ